MSSSCSYCRSPIRDTHRGRPWPDSPAAEYCCYGCLSLGEHDRHQRHAPADAPRAGGFALRIGVSLLVIAQSMILALGVNLEEATDRATKLAVHGAVLAGTLLVLVLLGGPLFAAAFREVRARRVTIEAMFAVTLFGALAASLQSFVTGRGPVYFEVVSVLLVVYALGKTVGARSRAAAEASTRVWASSLATCRLADGRVVDVTTVRPGDVVEVWPGEAVAVDGVIRSGQGFVSEAAVSGEPFAVVRRPGDRVLAGAASFDAFFRVEATAAGTARQVDSLLRAVEAARATPTSVQAVADRLSANFLPVIIAAAVATFVGWTYAAGWEVGLFNAMSVLLVACPCALGLATPIVVWSALGRLAERGLVVRSGDVVERLATVGSVAFDKTGTLTEDRFALVDIATTVEGVERARLLGWVSLVQERSGHPIAKPFAELPRPFGPEVRVEDLRVVPGCGVEATVIDGVAHEVRIGRPEWVGERRPVRAPMLSSAASGPLRASARHRVACSIDGDLAAVAVLAERLRDTVPQALTAFENLGLSVEVLTGDATDRAKALNLPNAHGGLLPDDKRRRVAELDRPLVVGDGINDAAALASAHVGIALASGTDVAIGAADATLYHGDLRVIPWAVALSREAMRIVRRNLALAATYNLVGIALAAAGLLHPVAAALLMVVSSALVAWSATRVGVRADHDCEAAPATESPVWPAAVIHASSVILQGFILVSLLAPGDWLGVVLAVVFVAVGIGSAIGWSRWRMIPHAADMAYGMLTLGNLGMILGWWADHGFGPLTVGTCDCAAAVFEGVWRPWMWVGMFAFANLGMALGARRPHGDPWAMYVGGNVGMAVGMALGGWAAAQVEADSVQMAGTVSLVGMTIGMVAGMLVGAEMHRRVPR
ncbi:MAG TPA: cation-translocating P-type ATPase [Gemmataceae bacterium]|nr:cation-translocating P-type ATPase [Gemmataceae bacterium]